MGWFSSLFSRKGNYVGEARLTLFDQNFAEEAWQKIDEQILLGKPSNLRSAVIDADKLVDFVLKKTYPSLTSMGERLKQVKPKFINDYEIYDQLWFAHKARNELVHNIHFDLSSASAKLILENFKNALVHLGALKK
jgi:hypothetical protein